MERRSAVYRGATREDVENAYHDDALRAAGDGFVPAAETWSTALGQQVLSVEYVFQPEQAPVVISELQHLKTWPKTPDPSSSGSQPSGAQVGIDPPLLNAAPPAKGRSNIVGCLTLIALAVVLWLAFGRGNSGGSPSATERPAAPADVSHLTGTFVRWEPVDESNGYAHFTVTNSGTTTETAECTIRVANDFGNFGFDILVGEPVGPGQTISGRIPLSVGEGSFLINQGEVTNC